MSEGLNSDLSLEKPMRTELIQVALEDPIIVVGCWAAGQRRGQRGIWEACCQLGLMGWDENVNLVDWAKVEHEVNQRFAQLEQQKEKYT